uniref:Uncharacterized protein n=1 Tax=Trypanosoma congolense (strain IL3000) TaxID=1068625 RepID=G0UNH1_TRYCI|nr:hypothetical protein TCIL3000_6_1660 [Trypanosoma congolense IL3000]
MNIFVIILIFSKQQEHGGQQKWPSGNKNKRLHLTSTSQTKEGNTAITCLFFSWPFLSRSALVHFIHIRLTTYVRERANKKLFSDQRRKRDMQRTETVHLKFSARLRIARGSNPFSFRPLSPVSFHIHPTLSCAPEKKPQRNKIKHKKTHTGGRLSLATFVFAWLLFRKHFVLFFVLYLPRPSPWHKQNLYVLLPFVLVTPSLFSQRLPSRKAGAKEKY